MKPALIIIDIQNWFFRTKERKRGLPKLIEKTNELADFFHEQDLPIIHVLTKHKADKSTWDKIMKRDNQAILLEGSDEAEELDEIHKYPNDKIVIKTRHSSFLRTNFEEHLHDKNIDTLIIAGVFTHGCVGLTSIEAAERDFDVLISEEAVFSHLQKDSEFMINMLRRDYNVVPVSNTKIKALISK